MPFEETRRPCGADLQAIHSPQIYEIKRGPREMRAFRGEVLWGLVIGMFVKPSEKKTEPKKEAKRKK